MLLSVACESFIDVLSSLSFISDSIFRITASNTILSDELSIATPYYKTVTKRVVVSDNSASETESYATNTEDEVLCLANLGDLQFPTATELGFMCYDVGDIVQFERLKLESTSSDSFSYNPSETSLYVDKIPILMWDDEEDAFISGSIDSSNKVAFPKSIDFVKADTNYLYPSVGTIEECGVERNTISESSSDFQTCIAFVKDFKNTLMGGISASFSNVFECYQSNSEKNRLSAIQSDSSLGTTYENSVIDQALSVASSIQTQQWKTCREKTKASTQVLKNNLVAIQELIETVESSVSGSLTSQNDISDYSSANFVSPVVAFLDVFEDELDNMLNGLIEGQTLSDRLIYKFAKNDGETDFSAFFLTSAIPNAPNDHYKNTYTLFDVFENFIELLDFSVNPIADVHHNYEAKQAELILLINSVFSFSLQYVANTTASYLCEKSYLDYESINSIV
ncbi:hypothetical protein ADUPG1_008288, partial [Aduncisulcus paluster]